ncbi:MAG: N-acetylmuramoyl-L-alanine amidase-like domain-containing protein [Candidatus Neomarinimicrobiota bacterium]
MKKILIIIPIILLCFSCAKKEVGSPAVIGNMTHTEIDSVLAFNAKEDLTITDRINFYSEMFLGTPYSWTATGDGPYALLESYPLVNFQETNCMIYCEHVLALAISDSWDNFFNNLQQIRYQNGTIGMKTRNHYTMADWLPENAWLLDDVSAKVGGEYTASMTRTISHKNFFKGKGMDDLRYIKEDRKISVDYVPMENMKDVKERVQNGDIVAMLYANKENVFSAHMLMIIEKNGDLYFREASTSTYSTFETEYDAWLAKKVGNKRYAGIAFMRVKDELNTKNSVILPWKISSLKEA